MNICSQPADGATCYSTPTSPDAALNCLAANLRDWFVSRFGTPTAAQRAAWPAIQQGENLLVAAPTGSGKTLAAFAPILSSLLLRQEAKRQLHCLYLAPLKALGRDAARNVATALRQIQTASGNGRPIRVGLRTGDTPFKRRRRQLLQPPDILFTTPESLAILLTQPSARSMFRSLRWVIVDELHAMAASKRGCDLALGLERLELLVAKDGGTLQRIGLSATCAPLENAAHFLAGGDRPVTIAQVDRPSPMELVIEPLASENEEGPRRGFMARLLDRLEPILRANRTTLVFTNIRSIAERVCYSLRDRYPKKAHRFAVHHSSLAPARRRQVEKRLKEGKLRCVVSSTSLELGVDIGAIDQVVLIHPPGGATKLLQRLGRSGHRPGQLRRGLVLTGGSADLLESIVTAAASRSGQIESLQVPQHPVDVLCQHLVGMAIDAWWTPAEALTLIRRAYPYRGLDDGTFRECLDYLSGKARDGSPWLLPRLRWEQGRFTIIDDRTARLMRRNLGTILNEDARVIRLAQSPEKQSDSARPQLHVGVLDEAYADRLQPGDRFVLDGRCFEFKRMEDADLLVEEVSARPMVPSWASHGWVIAPELAERLYLFRLQFAEALRESEATARELLVQDYHLPVQACRAVIELFRRQESVSEIPDVGTFLVEAVPRDSVIEYYLHTPLNRAGNDALLRVVLRRLEQELGWRGDCAVADLGILLSLPDTLAIEAPLWRHLMRGESFAEEFATSLTGSHSLRERFARVATTGLMVLRQPFGRRRKVGGRGWASRRLFDLVHGSDPDFVLLKQAEQEMRRYSCDLTSAQKLVDRLPRLAVHLRWLNEPSPLAESWTQPAEVQSALGK